MARKQKLASPLTEESRQVLFETVCAQSAPIEPKKALKLVPESLRMSPADAVQVLETYRAAGKLFVYPPKTAKGEAGYWQHDVRQMTEQALSELLPQLPQPATAKEIAGQLRLPFKVPEANVAAMLADLVPTGRVHPIPEAAKGKPRFWHLERTEFFRRSIVTTLQFKGPLAPAKLQKLVKGITDAEFAALLSELQDSRRIFPHPPVGKKGSAIVGPQPPAPLAYLKAVQQQLQEIIAKLVECGVDREDLRRAAVEVMEAAGLRFGTTRPSSLAADPGSTPSTPLVDLMRRIEPGADRGTLVGARDLRRQARMSKPHFDAALLELSRTGQVSLHRHDYPASLTDAERDELVTDGLGNYFVGVALRRND